MISVRSLVICLLTSVAGANLLPRAATTATASPAGGCTVSSTTTQLLTITTQTPGISCTSNTVTYYNLPSFTVPSSVKTCLVAITSTITSYDNSGLCWTSAVVLTKSTWTGGLDSACTLATMIRYQTVAVAATDAAAVQSALPTAEFALIRAGVSCSSTTTRTSIVTTVTAVKQSATALDSPSSAPSTSSVATPLFSASNMSPSLAPIASSSRATSAFMSRSSSSSRIASQSSSTVTSTASRTAATSTSMLPSSRTSSASAVSTTNAAPPVASIAGFEIAMFAAPCLAWLL